MTHALQLRPDRTDWAAVTLELVPLLAIPGFWIAFVSHDAFGWAALPVAFVAGLGWWRMRRRRRALIYALLRATLLLVLVWMGLAIFDAYFVICDSFSCVEESRHRNTVVLTVGLPPLLVAYGLSCVGSAILVARASIARDRTIVPSAS